ncbi:hypothetical protein [Halomonas sp. AOP27-A1-41]|uniref:hypothetical protein n=1 Tax=Halomonas sp. AOP27-A1-41 TaxID=3457707 RepID=UPI0040347510
MWALPSGSEWRVWRTPGSPDNQTAFARTRNAHREASYPHSVRMVCQMELASHLVAGAAFDSISTGEVALTTDLIASTPDHSLTLFARDIRSAPDDSQDQGERGSGDDVDDLSAALSGC